MKVHHAIWRDILAATLFWAALAAFSEAQAVDCVNLFAFQDHFDRSKDVQKPETEDEIDTFEQNHPFFLSDLQDALNVSDDQIKARYESLRNGMREFVFRGGLINERLLGELTLLSQIYERQFGRPLSYLDAVKADRDAHSSPELGLQKAGLQECARIYCLISEARALKQRQHAYQEKIKGLSLLQLAEQDLSDPVTSFLDKMEYLDYSKSQSWWLLRHIMAKTGRALFERGWRSPTY